MNLARVVSETAARLPQKPAVVFEGTTYSYEAFDREVARYTAVLHASGIGRGERVALQLPKCMEFLFFHFAALSVGAITLPLNPDYRPEEIRYFLSDARPSLVVTDRERFERNQGVLGDAVPTVLVDGGGGAGAQSLETKLARVGEGFARLYPAGDDDVAMICYTSGTTGRSKGAMITHRNLVSNVLALRRAWEWTERDVLLHVLPLFHVHGLNVATHGSLCVGSTILMQRKFDPRRAWEVLESEGCTLFMAVPTIYQRLLAEREALGRAPNLEKMRVFISGSAPLSDVLFRRFEAATGFRILERYGMTETGMNASNPIGPAGRVPMSVGHPLEGVRIRIAGEDGVDAGPGEVGEVWIRGPNVFRGYWEKPEKTEEAFVDGWFRSGDLGYLDPADGGRLYLVGRAKELIITGGYNVYPKEIENVLESHETVREAAVIGVPDEEFGEKIIAFVALREAAAGGAGGELIRYCKERLAGYKCPKRVHRVDALPRNSMGKIQKTVLAEDYRAGVYA